MDKIMKNHRGLELVTSCSLSHFVTRTVSSSIFKFTKIPLLVMYYLTKFDGVIESGFSVIPKITSANLCKPIYDINYPTLICPFEFEKCGNRKEKITKI